jgi:hypothetical protein
MTVKNHKPQPSLTGTYKRYQRIRLFLASRGDFDFDADAQAYAAFVHGDVKALAKLNKARAGGRKNFKLTKEQAASAAVKLLKAAGTVRLSA